MEKTLEEMENKRGELYRQLGKLGDFRQGTISATYRKCGKKNCACYKKEHPGHGPQYLWTSSRKGKRVAQYLRLGPELKQVQKQIEAGRLFQRWYDEVMDANERICRARPVPKLEDEQELEALKKKLRRKFFAKPGRKLKI